MNFIIHNLQIHLLLSNIFLFNINELNIVLTDTGHTYFILFID